MHAAHGIAGGVKPDLDLHLLEQFVTLARTQNFTRAATELNISQPALSRAIQRLEEQLGQPLFERKPREVALTDFGQLFLERAKEILRLVEETFSELTDASGRGRVRLGAIPTIAPYLLPSLLSSFSRNYPQVSVVVQEDTTDNLTKRCSHGEIDLAIVALPLVAKYLEVEPLFEEELLLVLAADHPLAAANQLAMADLDGYPFILLNEAHCLSDHIASFCQRQSLQPVTIERTSQLVTVQELVALHHGISLIPAMARKLDLSDRRVYRSIHGEKPLRTVAMMWNPYRFQSQAMKALMEHLRRN